MSTATTDHIDEPLVAQPEHTVLFMARRSNLRLTKLSRYPMHGPAGQKVGETQGEAFVFRDNVLRCPPDGTIVAEDGRKIDAAEVLAWLDEHPLNGSLEEGFWRVDMSAPAPSRAELQALMQAATRLDIDMLERLIREERAGWARQDILDTAEQALAEVRQIREAADAQSAAEARAAADAAAELAAAQAAAEAAAQAPPAPPVAEEPPPAEPEVERFEGEGGTPAQE